MEMPTLMNRIQKSDLDEILCYTKDLFNSESIKRSNIFISGATGFFGKWLLESLIYLNKNLNLELNIWALSRNPERFLQQFPFCKLEKCITWIKGDVRDFEFPDAKMNFIIHAATDADEKLNNQKPLIMIETIIEGTKHILDFAKEQPLEAFLFISSGAVYGEQPNQVDKIKETDLFFIDINNSKSAYAEAKRLAEVYCSMYYNKHILPVKIARCFSFVGPYLPLNKHFAIGNFISDAINSRNIVIKSDGSPQRSYMYPTDLVAWLLTILINGKPNTPYNVGSDESIDLKSLAELIRNVSNNPVDIIIQGKQIKSVDMIDKYVPNITRAKMLGLKVRTQFQDSIRKTILFNQKHQ